MNTHPCPQWTIPLRQTIDKKATTKKRQGHKSDSSVASFAPLSGPLTTISEANESQPETAVGSKAESRLASLQAELDALRLQNRKLQTQRDEAFQALEESLTPKPAPKITAPAANTVALQAEVDCLRQATAELEKRNSTLAERCKSLSAWAEQHRIATAKSKEDKMKAEGELGALKSEHTTALQALVNLQSQPKKQCNCDSLTEALGAIDRRNTILERDHAELKAQHSNLRLDHTQLKASHKLQDEKCEKLSTALANADRQHATLLKQHTNLENQHADATAELSAESEELQSRLSEAEQELASCKAALRAAKDRAADAERSVQSSLGAKALLKNAPVPTGLLSKASAVLQSAVDVLRLADGTNPEQASICATQVSTALSELDEEVSALAAESSAWAAKREVILRPQSQQG